MDNLSRTTPDPDPRKFRPIALGRCHGQTANDRFGPEASGAIRDRERWVTGIGPVGTIQPLTWPTQGPEGEDDGRSQRSIYRIVPSMQGNRNNLTALSNVHNLYFVGYQGHIFVYRPRGPANTLNRDPELQLISYSSVQGKVVGGYLDPRRPHTINHLITGFLGTEEIVVACFDDGDVTAYHVRDVAHCIWLNENDERVSRKLSGRMPTEKSKKAKKTKKKAFPRPILHENVGRTAWGLAIHQHSRLIAVSSNRAEVTVFAFAISSLDPGFGGRECVIEPKNDVEKWVRQRKRNWRIIILLGYNANNVPNVCFLDSENGSAEKVCAIDINGVMWIADIWKPSQPVARIQPPEGLELVSQEFYPDQSRGWGVLPLREDHFTIVHSIEELLGKPISRRHIKEPRARATPKIDVSYCLQDIPDNPCPPERISRVPRHLVGQVNEEQWWNNQQAVQNLLFDLNQGGPDDESDDDDGFGFEQENVAFEILGADLTGNGLPPGVVAEGQMEEDDADEEGMEGEDGEEEHGEEDEDEDEDEVDDEDEDEEDDTDEADEGEADVSDSDDVDGTNNENLNGGLAAGPFFDNGPTVPADLPAMNNFPYPFQEAFEGLGEALGELEGAIGAFNQGTTNGSTTALAPEEVKKIHGYAIMPPGELPTPPAPLPEIRSSRGFDFSYEASMARLDMVYFPHSGVTKMAPMEKKTKMVFARRAPGYNSEISDGPVSAMERLAPDYSILRTYEKDFEMVRIAMPKKDDRQEIDVVCSNAVTCEYFSNRSFGRWFRATSRLSMLAHIPDLCIAVLGSPTGRVLLATLTKLKTPTNDPTGDWVWNRGMRVEWALPKGADEEKFHKTKRPLYGLAVGRVPIEGAPPGVNMMDLEPTLPRRYRLMLHYQNHEILSYEITRDEQTGKVCVF